MVGRIGWMGRMGRAAIFLAAIQGTPMRASGADAAGFLARSHAMGPSGSLGYRLFVPREGRPGAKYPLMLTLHGAGERGGDNAMQLTHAFNRIWAGKAVQARHPCFVLAPQCPKDSQWVNTPWAGGSYDMDKVPISAPLRAVLGILDSLEKEFPIDPDRIYVSGISMGGFAAWYLALREPGRFAALVPVCGGADPGKAPSLARLPIWTFHAEDDGAVPVSGTREMVAALKAAGSPILYTEYARALGVGHPAWIPAGRNPDLVPWVFGQAR